MKGDRPPVLGSITSFRGLPFFSVFMFVAKRWVLWLRICFFRIVWLSLFLMPVRIRKLTRALSLCCSWAVLVLYGHSIVCTVWWSCVRKSLCRMIGSSLTLRFFVMLLTSCESLRCNVFQLLVLGNGAFFLLLLVYY